MALNVGIEALFDNMKRYASNMGGGDDYEVNNTVASRPVAK
jgi:hypothetical protein